MSKKPLEFSGETKPVPVRTIDVREEQRRVSTPKLPIRLTYLGDCLR
ncbi:MAG: hypothetical protein LN568_01470 [Rickettsia endosymbiont of Pseudomimeciton antennatum]|nr:hypothetical protein [Rickettsia endosymbiont of Pseudomimeciton antennatum]MCC8397782.1 hypothetical protein [Rickettsia endosymbiont of Labidopullus appendiculatus]